LVIGTQLQVLSDAGILPGGDMTAEAALAKLSYLLAKKELSLEEKRKVSFVERDRYLTLTLLRLSNSHMATI
jgi:L-asparaginase/Glu-tRNA(Gln) amidotransferase subunit D